MSGAQIPLEILSIATSFASRSGYNIILKEIGGSRKLQMIIGASEAQSIAVALQKVVTSRPMTHSFLQNILIEFGLTLKNVQIYRYEDGNYFAYTVLEDSFGNIKNIDCRPSDAICLALKMEKPILAFEELFEEQNMSYIEKAKASVVDEDYNNLSAIETSKLKHMLEDAINREKFEIAELIQQELNKR